ncbi:hypothetical protein ACI3KS_08805 [Microbacterium sp. ZW T5_45]|uniref:hypothetical protein n=1 Tax=Microbacterium sp. ZW T5_45 TaxID=3378080 RepID=UPI003852806D
MIEGKAVTVDAAVEDLLGALEAAGLPDASAGSTIDLCQSEPLPGAAYSAGITVAVGEDLVSAFDGFTAQLTNAGWSMTDDFDSADIDDDAPAARFVRDDITLDVTTGGATVGGVRYGTDQMELSVKIEDDCVRIPDSAYFTDLQDLERDIPRHG